MLNIDKIIKYILIIFTISVLTLLMLAPLLFVIKHAFHHGIDAFFSYIQATESIEAFTLTFKVAFFVIIANAIFGVSTAWIVTRYNFFGKNFIVTLIDIPLSASSVISGFIYILTYGIKGLLGSLFAKFNIEIIFAFPGLVMVTIFVTIPLIARELIPIMSTINKEYEEAAILLGASSWQSFTKVIFPNIKWNLLSSCLLCSARSMGEFGAVSVVSGYIRGKTVTVPQYVEILYNEYKLSAAFAVSLLLAIISIISILIKNRLTK